jgi:hypothetical protein
MFTLKVHSINSKGVQNPQAATRAPLPQGLSLNRACAKDAYPPGAVSGLRLLFLRSHWLKVIFSLNYAMEWVELACAIRLGWPLNRSLI